LVDRDAKRGPKGPIAISEQDGDGVRGVVGDGQVLLAVTIEIAGSGEERQLADIEIAAGTE